MLGSIFIEDRAPQTALFLGITIAVGGISLVLGLLLFGIQRTVAGIARVIRTDEEWAPSAVEVPVLRLLLYLSLGGAGLCEILAILTYAILARSTKGLRSSGDVSRFLTLPAGPQSGSHAVTVTAGMHL